MIRLLEDYQQMLTQDTAEVELLWGDATKAETELGWKRKVSFQGLVSMMVDSDMKEIAGIGSKEFAAKREVELEVAATK